MKTLYLTRGNSIIIDEDLKQANRINSCREGIDRIYKITEPTHIVYGSGEYTREMDADEGDLVITFYDNVFKHQAIIVKNADWFENIVEYEKKEQEEKLRWAEAADVPEAQGKTGSY